MAIKKIGLVTSSLKDGNKIRGVGFYTQHLLDEFAKDSSQIQVIPITKLDQIEKEQIAVVHYPFFDLFYHTLPMKKVVPTIVTIHDCTPLELPQGYPPGIRGWVNLQLQKISLKNSDRVITDSLASVKSINKYLGVPNHKLRLIYLGGSDSIAEVNNSKQKDKVKTKYHLPDSFALYIGDINYNKNIPGLIHACLAANIELVIVGKNAQSIEFLDLDHPELLHINSNLDVFKHEKIHRIGFVSDEDLPSVISLASVYIQASYYEGFGLPVVEAMTCGTPTIVSNNSSLAEIVDHNDELMFDPFNIENIKEKIVYTLNNKKSKSYYQNIVKKFTWQRTAKETLKVYSELCMV